MAGWSLATRVGACGAALAEDVYPRDGIAGFGGGLLCGSLSTDTDVRRALSSRTGMASTHSTASAAPVATSTT